MKRTVILLAALAASACSGTPADPEQAENDDLKIKAELAIEAKLKDPQSAQFESFVSRLSGEPVVCGTVNAKNGFGGYAGKQPFIYAGGHAVMADEIVPESFSAIWEESCKPLSE